MKRFRGVLMGLLAIAISSSLLVACGGSSGSGGSAASQSSSTTAQEQSASQGEPSAEFVGSGPNGKLAKVGKEASDAEREAASRVLEESFDAREAGDWQGQCLTLAALLKEQIEKAAAPLGKADCPKALEAQANGVPASARANTMSGPIDALRINQKINGFAFYHGKEGKDYVIPMIKQGGGWKVVALTTEELP